MAVRASPILEHYMPIPESGCWLWLGKWQQNGYGHTSGRGVAAHRYFYEHLVGHIAAGLSVCHKCDTPPCVNPAHMFLGTMSDNLRDAARKGRIGKNRLAPGQSREPAPKKEPRGVPDYVAQIRAFPAAMTAPEIAKIVGIDRSNVNKIRAGKAWPESVNLGSIDVETTPCQTP